MFCMPDSFPSFVNGGGQFPYVGSVVAPRFREYVQSSRPEATTVMNPHGTGELFTLTADELIELIVDPLRGIAEPDRANYGLSLRLFQHRRCGRWQHRLILGLGDSVPMYTVPYAPSRAVRPRAVVPVAMDDDDFAMLPPRIAPVQTAIVDRVDIGDGTGECRDSDDDLSGSDRIDGDDSTDDGDAGDAGDDVDDVPDDVVLASRWGEIHARVGVVERQNVLCHDGQ